MRITAKIVVLGGLVLATAATARAQEGCLLNGQTYPENAVVCSGGLITYCSNGTWQGDEGRRCDSGEGTYLSPLRQFRERNTEPIPDFYKEQNPGLHLE